MKLRSGNIIGGSVADSPAQTNMSPENWSNQSVADTTSARSVTPLPANLPSPSRSSEAGPSSYGRLPVSGYSTQPYNTDARDFAYQYPQQEHGQFIEYHIRNGHQHASNYNPDNQFPNDNGDPSSQPLVSPLHAAHHFETAAEHASIQRYETGEGPWSPASPTADPRPQIQRFSQDFGMPQDYRTEADPDKLLKDLNRMEKGGPSEISTESDEELKGGKKRRRGGKSKKSRSPEEQEPKHKHRKRDDEHERGGRRGHRQANRA